MNDDPAIWGSVVATPRIAVQLVSAGSTCTARTLIVPTGVFVGVLVGGIGVLVEPGGTGVFVEPGGGGMGVLVEPGPPGPGVLVEVTAPQAASAAHWSLQC